MHDASWKRGQILLVQSSVDFTAISIRILRIKEDVMGFKITNLLSTTKILLFSFTLNCALLTGSAIFSSSASAAEKSYEILVHSYQVEETIEFFKSRNFWARN